LNITEKVKSNLPQMTKSEYKIATYFLSNPDIFAFETLDDVASELGTSTTSVIRFCRRIGFSGYKAFQNNVRKDFGYKLTLPDKFNRAVRTGTPDAPISRYALDAISCIEHTFSNLSEKSVGDAVSAITGANRVFCFGLKESFALAHYAYTRFLTIRSNVFLLSAGHSGEIESVLSLDKGDVCIFFLFHRYTKPAPEILKLLKKQGVKVILITSPPYDGLSTDSTIVLPCFADINGIKNSAAAPICLTDHLCNMSAIANGDKTLDYMKKSETLFKEFTFGE